MQVQLIALVALLAVLVGCPETPTERAVDAAQAREEIAVTVNANLDVASTEAKGSYDVAKAKCDALNGNDKTACVSTTNATATRNAALESAERFDH